MPYGWCIVKQRFESTAFDGEGARLYGGRWNTIGNPMVYTASSHSLAALEIMVNVASPDLLKKYTVFSIEFPDKFVTVLDEKRLPSNWCNSPVPTELQEIGDDWLASKDSVILAVPSTVVPNELIYLIDPAHADFSTLLLSKPHKFVFDPRLIHR